MIKICTPKYLLNPNFNKINKEKEVAGGQTVLGSKYTIAAFPD
jgi:hypothetical protein